MKDELLSILEKNSRIDFSELAVLLGVTEEKLLEELSNLEKEGVICGCQTRRRIFYYPEVKAVYLISGGYDLLVILEEKNLKEIAGFVSDKLSTLDSVLSTATHFILKKYKDHGTILNKETKDEREVITP